MLSAALPSTAATRQPLSLTDRDLEILTHAAHARVLSTEQLYHLVRDRWPTSPKTLGERATLLLGHGYLGAVRTARGRLWHLGPEALSCLARGRRLSDEKLLRARRTRLEPLDRLEHWCELGWLYVVFLLSLRQQERYEMVDWHVEPRPRGLYVFPDAITLVRDRARPLGKDLILFSLEMDRATMRAHGGGPDGHPILEKLRRAWRTLREGRFHAAYQLPRTAPTLVLVVTPSSTRRNNLAQLARLADDRQSGSPFFRFCARPEATELVLRSLSGPTGDSQATSGP